MPNSKYLKKIIIDKFSNDKFFEKNDVVIDEERVTIYLNGTKAISIMCIPKDQDAHAIGFLMSENIISDINDVTKLEIKNDGMSVFVEAKIYENMLQNLYKEKTLTSGCGGGVTGHIANYIEIPFNKTKFEISAKIILSEIKQFYDNSELYILTGCVHKAMIYLENKKTVTAEDIGRHNAIDKVIGLCKINKYNTNKSILFVSGRLSSEMVTKVVMHKIPIIVSRTAPTYLGVVTAHKHGVTLIGFARGRKMNIYTHSGRIVE
jgi:FdhD protein